MNNIIATSIYSIIIICAASALYRTSRSNPVFWNVAFQGLIGIGTLLILDLTLTSDVIHTIAIFISLTFFIIGAAVGYINKPIDKLLKEYKTKPIEKPPKIEKTIILIFLFASLCATTLYYYLVGYNMLIVLIFGGMSTDFSTMRLDTYSGERYLAPGYFNQFKNTILPITSIYIYLVLRKSMKNFSNLYIIIMIPILLLALVGTGQRGFLIYTAIAAAFGLALLHPQKKIELFSKTSILVLLFIISIFAYLTSAYKEVSGDKAILDTFLHTAERIVFTQQEGGMIAFRILYEKDIALFSEWTQAFLGILPGTQGSRIAHEIHFVMYGTERGTVPPSLVGSTYHNGGLIGVAIVYTLIGYSYTLLYANFLNGRKTIIRSICYGYIFYNLSSFISGSPFALIDNGVLTAAILLKLSTIRIYSKKKQI